MFLPARRQPVSLNCADTSIPPQDGVIVARGTDSGSLLKRFHRLQQPFVCIKLTSVSGADKGCFCEAFEDNSFVIGTLILVFQAREHTVGLLLGHSFAELIAQGKDQHDQGLLMVWLYFNDIAANTFGLGGVIRNEIPSDFFPPPGEYLLPYWVLFHPYKGFF